ncbi:MAG: CheR family methyltransferase [Candidatus Goldiibacteriota bacterium]
MDAVREKNKKRRPMNDMDQIDDKTFASLKEFVYSKCGITFSQNKKPLVSARIRKRMRALGYTSPKKYYEYVHEDPTGLEVVFLLDSLATNVTAFYREAAHFDQLKKILGEWKSKGQKRFRFWSSACSSGEEPYTMAFAIKDVLDAPDFDIKILGTDISTKVLGAAHQGVYDAAKVMPVPEFQKKKYMEKFNAERSCMYSVKREIRDLVVFKRLNLVEVPFPMKGPMDAVFCRNVMIYFDRDIRKKLVEEFYRLIKPGGYLFVGHTESLVGISGKFNRLGPSVYIK